MTKYILHGGYTGTKNELNRSFYEEITKDVPDEGTVLLVYFSRTDDEVLTLFAQDKQNILEQTKTKDLSVVLANQDDFEDQVIHANALYMRGGDTDKLLTKLRQFPNFKTMVQGKTVAGSSAGAYAIGRYSVGHSVNYIREGLGLVPLRVVCHYKSSRGRPNEESLTILKNTAQELDLVFLRDYEWIVKEVGA